MTTKPIDLTDNNFVEEVLSASQPVLVDFWASWCGPCRVVAPTVDALAADFEGRAKVGKVNIDTDSALAPAHGITAIPSLLIFQEGRVVDRIIGAATQQVLAERLEAAIAVRGNQMPLAA